MLKKLLFLVLLLALGAAPAVAQLPALHAQPERSDDTVVLTLLDEGRAAWQRAAAVLAARGYSLGHSDADLLTLTTDFTAIKHNNVLAVFVQVQGHQLLLRARWIVFNEPISAARAVRRGGLLGTSYEWPELEAIAQALGGTAAYYNSAAQ
ncbi:hypothetical protein [Hymenobacter psychrophilus]|uniref:Uncharacterized protein n=1 Tax=Hymenobacter psychrophilus TaxID=651662 RepID=A0A1H3DEN0_9BACT|nr:hypothetical protein [Hymenobacter psychrophilus]SDX64923.1 hypothetical protein SAMN04488069_102333 [Hymenobacter psychrophilus]